MVIIAPSGASILTKCVWPNAPMLAFLNISTWHLEIRLQMSFVRTILESMVVSMVVNLSASNFLALTLWTKVSFGLGMFLIGVADDVLTNL